MKGKLAAWGEAVSLLTVVPWFRREEPTERRMGWAMAWFPAVGAILGGLTAAAFSAGASYWPIPVSAALGLLVLEGLTGALHLDGFADTVDGIGSWKGPEEALRIMRDSRIGAIGAAGLVILLLLKWALLQGVPLDGATAFLAAACAVSRLSMVLSAHGFPYVPGQSGLGRLLTDQRSWKALAAASLLGGAIALAGLGPARGFGVLALAGAVSVGLNAFFVRRLGGITGDTLGAVNEVVEVSVLLFLVAR